MTWHPILAAVEREPGRWELVAQYDRVYGEVRLVDDAGELAYRARDRNGNQLGPFASLRDACMAVHRVDIRAHGAPEFQGYPDMSFPDG
jgi:hypothetical protein